ncbi:pilus assembly protein [Sphingomonas parva]|uniref:Pilus assembly protein n=1 Tax=Sphingomonas parva TaxID=2555898 RepID=A0A4Y8ZT93_9SPHN|nr:TadE/TadG family type IV pilus assembly protein [Sphingomonas parva]TFI58345.1 pilus assembly protein [Sphingomonas parva]
MRLRRPFRNERGAGAVEFALAAPVFLGMIIGVSQLGVLYFANAGVKHAVDEGARRAAIFRLETDAEREAAVLATLRKAAIGTKGVLTPAISKTSDNGLPVLDIGVSYRVPLNFIFFETPPVTLNYTRRVYLQTDGSGSGATSTSSSTGGASTTSSAGGTTSSTGGTTSTSSSTTSSTGGTTSSTGGTTTTTTSSTGGTTTSTTSSTGGTTSASTTSSTGGTTTPPGNGNGNGNGNASSSGNGNNGNGACKKNCK